MTKIARTEAVVHPSITPGDVAVTRPRTRFWPALVVVALFWAFLYAHYNYELAMFTRFISRMIALGVLVLGMLIWWFTNRGISLRDRFLAIGLVIISTVVAGLVCDASVDAVAILLTALPIVFTAWVAWLFFSQNASLAVQRLGFCAVTVLPFVYMTLVRWEGLDGRQRPQFSWRWTPTAEQLFLKGRDTANTESTPGSTEAWEMQPGDWAEFRGGQRDGVVPGVTVAADWTHTPPKQLWRQRVGPAWSSVIIVDGNLVTQEQRGESESVVCYEGSTGKELWSHNENLRFYEGLAGPGPRATPTFDGGRIYVSGATGKLVCLNATDGKLLWSHDTAAEAEAEPPQWGYSTSPLVVEGKVITFAGGEMGRSILAYDAISGERVWAQDGGKQTYSSPQLATIAGRRQIVMHDNRQIVGLNIDDGTVLWERANRSELAVPMLQPHLVGPEQLLIQGDPGVALIEVKHDAAGHWTTEDRWSATSIKPDFNDFVIHDSRIYGLDDGIFCCVDVETGKRLWKKGRYGHGQVLLLADQRAILVLGESGEVILVAANPERHEELGRFQAIEGKTWNHPVVAHRRLYVRNAEEMACYELK